MSQSLRRAATVIPIRRLADGAFEVLLLKRAASMKFAPEFWAFPGGAIDPEDYEADPDDVLAAAFRAASREAQEECGITIPVEEQLFHSHWTAPEVEPIRFSTWFMLAEVSNDQSVVLGETECDDFGWFKPSEVLEGYRQRQMKLMPPTFVSLLEMTQSPSFEQFLGRIKARRPPQYLPRVADEGKRVLDLDVTVLYQGDVAYHGGELDALGLRHRLVVTRQGMIYTNDLGDQPAD